MSSESSPLGNKSQVTARLSAHLQVAPLLRANKIADAYTPFLLFCEAFARAIGYANTPRAFGLFANRAVRSAQRDLQIRPLGRRYLRTADTRAATLLSQEDC